MRWLPLESNPEVMTSFLRKLGLPSEWKISDVFGLDPEILGTLPRPVAALILLYPINEKTTTLTNGQDEKTSGHQAPSTVFFMKQTIGNACGTVALIHAVANNQQQLGLSEGKLKTFLDSLENLTPEAKGNALEEAEEIRDAHEAAGNEGQTAAPDREDKTDLHFVTLVNVEGQLVELDGRRSSPILHGPTSKDTFLEDAANVCKTVIAADPTNVKFSVMALARDD